MKKIIIASLFVIALVLAGALGLSHQPAQAAITGQNQLYGWAWSSNIGWISFNSNDLPAQQAPPAGGGGSTQSFFFKEAHAQTTTNPTYNVTMDSNGNLTGFAWSSNIGWIQFGNPAGFAPLSGFPNDQDGAAMPARVDTSTGFIMGWARACAGTATGDCKTMASRTDGWDGWIELAQTSNGDGNAKFISKKGGTYMDVTTGKFYGYAWGGDVVGWIDMSPAATLGVTGVTYGGGGTPLSVSCSASPTTANTGDTINFSTGVTATNAPYTFTVTYGDGTQTGPSTVSTASFNTSHVYTAANSYAPQVTVTDGSGRSGSTNCPVLVVQQQQTQTNNSSLSMNIGSTGASGVAEGTTFYKINVGDPFGVAWTNTYAGVAGYMCTASISNNGNSLWPSWSGLATAGSNSMNVTDTSSVPTGTYVFTLSCSNPTKGIYPPSAVVTLKVLSVSEHEH